MLVKEVIICQQHIYGYRTQPNMNEIPNDCKCIWGISCQIDFKTFLNGLIFLLKPNCYAKKQSRIFTGSRKIDHGINAIRQFCRRIIIFQRSLIPIKIDMRI